MKSRTHPALSVRLPVWRARVLVLLLFAGFMMLAARALYLQGLNKDFLQARGESRYQRTIDAVANRGTITDRNGDPLAISTPVESVWASPQDMPISMPRSARNWRGCWICRPKRWIAACQAQNAISSI